MTSFNDEITRATHNLIRQFITRRRETVIEILVERRPDLVKGLELESILGVSQEENNARVTAIREAVGDGTYQWSGIWRSQWKYRLHGNGCELVNLDTEERFNWDVGDPLVFFTGEIGSYLKWQAQAQPDNPNIITCREIINNPKILLLPLLNNLVEKQILAYQYPHGWKLIKD